MQLSSSRNNMQPLNVTNHRRGTEKPAQEEGSQPRTRPVGSRRARKLPIGALRALPLGCSPPPLPSKITHACDGAAVDPLGALFLPPYPTLQWGWSGGRGFIRPAVFPLLLCFVAPPPRAFPLCSVTSDRCKLGKLFFYTKLEYFVTEKVDVYNAILSTCH